MFFIYQTTLHMNLLYVQCVVKYFSKVIELDAVFMDV